MTNLEPHVKLGEWLELRTDAESIRTQVFVQEQNVPIELERDAMDIRCLHAVAYNELGQAIGTGRLLPDGHIGRMAVLRDMRGLGVGMAILRALLEQAKKRGDIAIELNAQISAEVFYEREGFSRVGEVFVEAGIDHVHMTKNL